MNIKVEVNIDDVIQGMFEDSDNDFECAIKHEITCAVMRRVSEEYRPKIDKLIENHLTEKVNTKLELMIKHTLDNLVEIGEIEISGQTIRVEDYIKKLFMQNHGWRAPHEQIERIAKGFGAEMKVQYNNHFAMNIVKNLSEQGLLNDDVAKALLAPPSVSK